MFKGGYFRGTLPKKGGTFRGKSEKTGGYFRGDFCPNRGFSDAHPRNLDIQECTPPGISVIRQSQIASYLLTWSVKKSEKERKKRI